MANSLFKIKYDGSFSFVPEEKLMNEIKKSHTWFTNTLFGKICTIVFACIDLCGFYQLATNTINISALNRWVIISAFLVAFELAPLYLGYSMCLNCYNMGKQIHSHVKKYSICTLLLGIIANIIGKQFNAYYNCIPVGFNNSNVTLSFSDKYRCHWVYRQRYRKQKKSFL